MPQQILYGKDLEACRLMIKDMRDDVYDLGVQFPISIDDNVEKMQRHWLRDNNRFLQRELIEFDMLHSIIRMSRGESYMSRYPIPQQFLHT